MKIIENQKKFNCWEVMSCCTERASYESGHASVCPVKTATHADGLNGGTNGGRICWLIMNGHCGDQEGTACIRCEFLHIVMEEEGIRNSCYATGAYLNSLERSQDRFRNGFLLPG